ncbi:hypothetical protein FMJ36_23690 [Klebsiella michiganensis]|uniref:hypothetical protein n=1 Tax=Klebsiella michiganensis TaxID=1134687 RepID=UPI001CCFA766|nr:hypothetical protein [Klebsiella michiganensis]MBZ7501002.1 hypothetical protein [Klebsiella michiganensis]
MRIKILIVILASLLIVSCDSEKKDIIGYWANESPECTVLCGFTIVKKDSALSDLFVYFDKGIFSSGVNGPLIKQKNNLFIVNGSSGDYLLKERNGYLYNKTGDKYVRTGNPIGVWSDITGNCSDLCEFEIKRETDFNGFYVIFNNKRLNGYYDGALYRKKDGSLIISGVGGDFILTPDKNGNLTSAAGAVYKKKSGT